MVPLHALGTEHLDSIVLYVGAPGAVSFAAGTRRVSVSFGDQNNAVAVVNANVDLGADALGTPEEVANRLL